MKVKWLKVGLLAILTSVIAWVNVTGLTSAQASTLKDGTYAVPVSVVQDTNGQAGTKASLAAKYFKPSAQVVVQDGKSQVTIGMQDGAAALLGTVTVAGQSAKSGNNLVFTLSQPEPTVKATFKITVVNMTQSAWFKFDWSKVPTVASPAAASSSASSSSAVSSSTRSAASSSADSAATSSTRAASSGSSTATTTTAVKSKTKTAAPTADPTQGWTYQVLQADSHQISAANKFYTHVADIQRVGDRYQVKLTVQYGKNSGMTESGFKPLTTNGEAAQHVTYRTTAKNYVVTYTFDVAKLRDLNHLIKGTVHVTVPTVGINQTFTVQFKFSHQKTTSNAAATASSAAGVTATTVPGSSTTGGQRSDERLPQTSEHVAWGAAIIGVLGLIALVGVNLRKRGDVE